MRLLCYVFAAAIASCVVGTAAAESIEIGEVAQGPVYYNRPHATVAEHNAELGLCMKLAGPAPRSRPGTMLAYSASTHATYDVTWISDLIWNGPVAGLRAVRVENCMLVRGWRAVRAPQTEVAALSASPPAELTSRLEPWIGASSPPGDIVRVYNNEALYPGSYRTASRPRPPTKDQLSLKLFAADPGGAAAPTAALVSSTIDPKWPQRPLKVDEISKLPPEAGVIVVRVTGISNTYGTGISFAREGLQPRRPPSIDDHQPDVLKAATGFMFAKREGNWFVLAAPPGRWEIASSGFVNYCLGSPSFEVKSGEVVYAGTFHLQGPTLEPELGLEPARAFLGPLAEKIRAAAYLNGSRPPCNEFGVIYGLEFPKVPRGPHD